MSGNTIGKLFTVTTFGESHGPALALHRGRLPAGACARAKPTCSATSTGAAPAPRTS